MTPNEIKMNILIQQTIPIVDTISDQLCMNPENIRKATKTLSMDPSTSSKHRTLVIPLPEVDSEKYNKNQREQLIKELHQTIKEILGPSVRYKIVPPSYWNALKNCTRLEIPINQRGWTSRDDPFEMAVEHYSNANAIKIALGKFFKGQIAIERDEYNHLHVKTKSPVSRSFIFNLEAHARGYGVDNNSGDLKLISPKDDKAIPVPKPTDIKMLVEGKETERDRYVMRTSNAGKSAYYLDILVPTDETAYHSILTNLSRSNLPGREPSVYVEPAPQTEKIERKRPQKQPPTPATPIVSAKQEIEIIDPNASYQDVLELLMQKMGAKHPDVEHYDPEQCSVKFSASFEPRKAEEFRINLNDFISAVTKKEDSHLIGKCNLMTQSNPDNKVTFELEVYRKSESPEKPGELEAAELKDIKYLLHQVYRKYAKLSDPLLNIQR